MKGRLFVVDEKTKKKILKDNILFAKSPKIRKMWVKTMSDIMADMLYMEKGDYVFLWQTKGKNPNSIFGVYRVVSAPFYIQRARETKPFKIYIEEAYHFSEPILEEEILNKLHMKEKLWNIVGKKISGKPRASIPLTEEEVEILIQLLKEKNASSKDYKYYKKSAKRYKTHSTPVEFEYGNIKDNKEITKHSDINPKEVSFFVEKNKRINVRYEKMLETILNYEMTKKNKKLFKQMGIDCDKVKWFSNNLIYGVERSAMDYLIIESEDGSVTSRMIVIELSKDRIDDDHINKVYKYSKWVREVLTDGINIVKPILICFDDYKNKNKKQEKKQLISEKNKSYNMELDVYKYAIDKSGLKLEKLDY